jgi:ribosomal protein S6
VNEVDAMNVKTYEGTIIFPSSLMDEQINQSLDKVKSEIEKLKGAVKQVITLGRRNFARRMKKQDNGQYICLRFELPPGNMEALRVRLKMNEDITRIQIVDAEDLPLPLTRQERSYGESQ